MHESHFCTEIHATTPPCSVLRVQSNASKKLHDFTCKTKVIQEDNPKRIPSVIKKKFRKNNFIKYMQFSHENHFENHDA